MAGKKKSPKRITINDSRSPQSGPASGNGTQQPALESVVMKTPQSTRNKAKTPKSRGLLGGLVSFRTVIVLGAVGLALGLSIALVDKLSNRSTNSAAESSNAREASISSGGNGGVSQQSNSGTGNAGTTTTTSPPQAPPASSGFQPGNLNAPPASGGSTQPEVYESSYEGVYEIQAGGSNEPPASSEYPYKATCKQVGQWREIYVDFGAYSSLPQPVCAKSSVLPANSYLVGDANPFLYPPKENKPIVFATSTTSAFNVDLYIFDSTKADCDFNSQIAIARCPEVAATPQQLHQVQCTYNAGSATIPSSVSVKASVVNADFAFGDRLTYCFRMSDRDVNDFYNLYGLNQGGTRTNSRTKDFQVTLHQELPGYGCDSLQIAPAATCKVL